MATKAVVSKKTSKFYFPNLDASRFYAFIPVFLTHCFYSNDSNIINSKFYLFVHNHLQLGLLGLDYFFVLSGFLITWIIIEEQKQTNKFSLKNFYVRRGLRIFPLYFLMVAIGFIIQFVVLNFSSKELNSLPNLFYFLSFTLNFYIIHYGRDFLFFLVFFWSVSVEEQFYLVWSLLLKFLGKYLNFLCYFMILVSIVFRYLNLNNNNELVFNTLSSLANFGCGSLLAFYSFYSENFKLKITNLSKKIIFVSYLLFALCVIFYNSIFNTNILIVFERFIFSLFFTFIIAEQAYCKNSFFKLGTIKFFDFFGKLSFGLYCYHGLLLTIYIKLVEDNNLVSKNIWVFLFAPVLLFSATLITSYLSFILFEKKILLIKKKVF
jgi:peptidoglycan/LPS O-acetylase OafA/YrhL